MTVTIENLYTGNGSTTDYSFTFPYLDTSDIKVTLATVATTAYSLLNATTVRFNSAPGNGVAIRIYRETAFDTPKATFYPGSAIRANDLNDNTLQNLYVNQESNDKVADAWLTGDPTVISTESWYTTDDTKIGTTKAIENRISAKIDTAMEADVLAGTDLTKTASGGQVTINHSVTGAASVNNSNGVVLQDLTINGRGHVTATGSYDLDGRYYTETELDAGQLDNRYYTETEADARFYNLSSVEEIQSGETWVAADNKVATTSAIDARIVDLVDDVGGFVPIANETSFPNANPDVNNGAGTLVSIKALSNNLTSNGSGVATISNGTVGNSTVTINGLENSTTYGATLGMIVETTSTLNTYTFHRVTPKATEVTTVAGSITNVNTVATNINSVNDFADKYRIASSAPSSNNDDGDLYYNTSDNKLYVYNGSAWEVAASLNGSGGTVTGDITFSDSTKLELGTGSDLQIYHDGSNSYIDDAGTGNLYIRGSASIEFRKAGGTEKMLYAEPDAGVELYWDNTKTFETNSNGATVYGGEGQHANLYIYADEGDDNADKARIQQSSTGDFWIENYTSGSWEAYLKATGNGAVELYYDNSKKLETASDKILFHAHAKVNANDTYDLGASGARWRDLYISNDIDLIDAGKLLLGASDDLQIFHDASDSYINNSTGVLYLRGDTLSLNATSTTDKYLYATNGGAVNLYHDNSLRLATTAAGVNIGGNLSSDSGTSFTVNAGGASGTAAHFIARCGSENAIVAVPNGAVELYYDNDLKLFTKSAGVEVTATGAIPNFIVRGKEGYGASITLASDDGDDPGDYARILQHTDEALYFQVYNAANNAYEDAIVAKHDGAVELYYDNVKKFETQSGGVKWTGNATSDGNVWWTDGKKAQFGASNDLEIYHNSGSNKSIIYHSHASGVLSIAADHLNLADYNSEHPFITCDRDGAVELYYDNSKKLETISTGVRLSGLEAGEVWAEFYADEGDDNADKWRMGASVNTDYYLQNYAGGSWETNIKAIGNGAVELYHDATKKFETSSSGVTVTGNIDLAGSIGLADSEKVTFGAGTDLQIYHDGTNNVFKSSNGEIRFVYGDDYMFRAIPDAANRFYYDHSTKAETTSTGFMVNGHLDLVDNNQIRFGAGQDLQIYHNGSNNYIVGASGQNTYIGATNGEIQLQPVFGTDHGIRVINNGSVELYYDGSKKLETDASGVTLGGRLLLGDNYKVSMGDDADFQTYHDGSNSFIKNSTNTLVVLTAGMSINDTANAESMAQFYANGAAELYYDNAKKLETNSTGVTVNGTVSANAGSFVDNSLSHPGPVLNVSGDDANVWYGRIGNETYHNSTATGFKFYVNNSGSALFYHTGNAEYKDWLMGSYDNTTYKTDVYKHTNGTVGLYYDGNLRINTSSAGVYVTGSVTESSDIALKNDINTIQNPLELIEQIRGIDFTWKNNGTKSMGVIAQDVEKVFPELVHGEEGSKAVQYSGLIGALVESVKELSAKVAALESS